MRPFRDSTALVNDPEALRRVFDEDGYVFLRGIANRDVLTSMRAEFVSILEKHGWLDPAFDRDEVVPCCYAHYEGEPAFLEVYKEVQRLESFNTLSHSPELLGCMRALLGETAFPHPLAIARLVFPNNNEAVTPPHQDYPNNQGTEDLYACWVPLADCPKEHAGLAVLVGSHKFGLLPLKFAIGPGSRQADIDARLDGLEWVSSDFRQGDVLIFHSLTVHRSLENHTRSMRLSVDYRYQREGEELTLQSLRPHFQAQDWKAIYQGWKDRSLAYYWKQKNYRVVPWNAELHKLPASGDAEVERLIAAYNELRKARYAEALAGAARRRAGAGTTEDEEA